MHGNSNGVEPGPMQKCDVLLRNVILAVLLPECSRPFGSKQLQHQRIDLTRRLWTAFEQPHVAFRHHPIAQIGCAKKEWPTLGINDLFMVGVCELRASEGNERQQKKRQM